jgi:leucine-zipper-like transcriptional regulator 1
MKKISIILIFILTILFSYSCKQSSYPPKPGKDWSRATSAAAFSSRDYETSVVFDDKMWVIGGRYKKDVWCSSNGVDWTLKTGNAGFLPRYGQTSVVYNNLIWVIGGLSNVLNNDVWCSSNGIDWALATGNAGFMPTAFHASVVFDNKIWVIGGRGIDSVVWYS